MPRNTTGRLLRSALAAALLAALAPASASAVPTDDWRDYTLIAEDRLSIGPNLNLSGNFAVTGVGGAFLIGVNTFQLDDVPPPFVASDTLNLAGQASVANAYTNQITGNPTGEVRGVTQPQVFPLDLNVPSFPTVNACNTCALNAPQLTVEPGDSVTLTPGCYGELFARNSASVFLQPGVYTFLRWDIQKFASVTANGPVTIFIREKIDTEEGNFLGAASGQVDDFMVFIAARKSCLPTSSAINSKIGKFSIVIGTFLAPEDDDFNFNKGAILLGTTVAREIDVRGQHEDRPPTPTPTPQATPTPNNPTPTPNNPTPTPNNPTPTPNNPTPTPNNPTPTPNNPTPTPNNPTPTPSVTPTPNFPTPTPTQPFTPPTPTPSVTPTPSLPTPTPTQPFTPPTPTPLPTINPPPTPTASVAPRKHPWGKKSGLIESLFPSRTGSRIAPSMKRPLGVRR